MAAKVSPKFKKIHPKFELPVKTTDGAACYDFCYYGDRPITLIPVGSKSGMMGFFKKGVSRAALSLGCSVEIPSGYELQIRPRSGWALKNGISVLNSPGTIDSDFRGELKAILINLGDEDVVINPGMRICQGKFSKTVDVVLSLTEEISKTERGSGGFGSTGK